MVWRDPPSFLTYRARAAANKSPGERVFSLVQKEGYFATLAPDIPLVVVI